MVRRHPHVFGEKQTKNACEVLKNWEQIKKRRAARREEKNADGSQQAAKEGSLLDECRELCRRR